MTRANPDDQALLDAFVTAFVTEETDISGRQNGQPVAYATEPEHLKSLYAVLPGTFPPLYERLVLSYRWPSADLPELILLANPPGPCLDGLLAQIQWDRGLYEVLESHGCIPFGRGPGGSYDPVCFDTRHRHADGDCRVVQIDHEAILCRFRLREVSVIAETFRALVSQARRR